MVTWLQGWLQSWLHQKAKHFPLYKPHKTHIFSDKYTMDINELASLNDDISPELIEQLQLLFIIKI